MASLSPICLKKNHISSAVSIRDKVSFPPSHMLGFLCACVFWVFGKAFFFLLTKQFTEKLYAEIGNGKMLFVQFLTFCSDLDHREDPEKQGSI